MKYTRYNLKRKNKKGITFVVVVFFTLILSILIGALMLKGSPASNNIANKKLVPIKNKSAIKYIAIQGGLYKVKEYADETLKILSSYGNPFIITEKDKTMRVLLGVYSEEEATKQMKILLDKGVDNSKMTFEIPQSDLCDVEIMEIINGYFQIISNASDKKVSSVFTADFKKWCLELKEVDSSSKNIATLKDLKSNVNTLPKELSKDKISGLYIYIYNTLQKFIIKMAPNT